MKSYYEDDLVTLYHGDCLAVLRALPDESVAAVVTDPPYGLSNTDPKHVAETLTKWVTGDHEYTPPVKGGFMGKTWDSFVPPPAVWDECMRVLKPGGHLLVFAGTRTQDLMGLSIRLAGFEIRDGIGWIYGSGFPKSLDVSKAIDKAARGVPQGGVDPTSPNHGKYRTTTTEGKRWDGDSGQGYGAGGSRFLVDGMASGSATAHVASGDAETAPDAEAWGGWGTALKPAIEPVVMARKPLEGTVAANVLEWGTGALNIDASRVGTDDVLGRAKGGWQPDGYVGGTSQKYDNAANVRPEGRWPANVLLDPEAAAAMDEQSGVSTSVRSERGAGKRGDTAAYGEYGTLDDTTRGHSDSGGASRFFPVFKYQAKAPKKERPVIEWEDGTKVQHPTVKPLALMEWLVTLVTPPGGVVLDPFAGSGTTLQAARNLGRKVIGVEFEEKYCELIVKRLSQQAFDSAEPGGSNE